MEPEDSPSKIAKSSPYCLYFPQATSESILEELSQAYRMHRSKNAQQSTVSRLIRKIMLWAGQFTRIMKELWSQIIPEAMRGKMELDDESNEPKPQPFSDYSRLGKIFFVLVLQPECNEDCAVTKATEVCPEGLSSSLGNLSNTSPECKGLPGLAPPFRYSILFFKFDIFRQLRWIASLQKTSLEVGQEPIQELKKKIDEIVQNLEEIQKSFLGSYLQKEERFAFEQEMLP